MKNRINPIFPIAMLCLVLTSFWIAYRVNFSTAPNDPVPAVRILIPDPEIPEGSDDSYVSGYRNGYFSFVAQDMEEKGMTAVSYSSLKDRPDSAHEHESFERGYVDGYHKATAKFSCPCP